MVVVGEALPPLFLAFVLLLLLGVKVLVDATLFFSSAPTFADDTTDDPVEVAVFFVLPFSPFLLLLLLLLLLTLTIPFFLSSPPLLSPPPLLPLPALALLFLLLLLLLLLFSLLVFEDDAFEEASAAALANSKSFLDLITIVETTMSLTSRCIMPTPSLITSMNRGNLRTGDPVTTGVTGGLITTQLITPDVILLILSQIPTSTFQMEFCPTATVIMNLWRYGTAVNDLGIPRSTPPGLPYRVNISTTASIP